MPSGVSLRARLLAVILIALLASFAAAAILSTWHDARMVRDEVAAALATGRKDAALAIASDENQPALARFIASFNGSRHIAAALLNAENHVIEQSRPLKARTAPPAWFAALIAPTLNPVVITLTNTPPYSTLRLIPEPTSEIGERWSEARDKAALLGLLSVLTGLLCSVTLSRGLRPLQNLASGLDRLGAGERDLSLAHTGPPEIAQLADAFNRLSALLGKTEQHNTRLQSQLLRIAEEERTDIARDLHDEVGPLLFAINTRTATIASLAQAGATSEIPAQLQSIRQSVGILQDGVRAMLHKLRDDEEPAPDLPTALRELIGFWSELRPQTSFALTLADPPPAMEQAHQTALLRVAQEGVTNAVRHGAPTNVRVDLACDHRAITLQVIDNGTAGGTTSGATALDKYGLRGLRERLSTIGGSLSIATGPGWTLTAKVPRA